MNFLILNHPEEFSGAEIKALESQFFDEVKFAQWALEELKAAKARGESISLVGILAKSKTPEPSKQRAPKTQKKAETKIQAVMP